jgi:hypothetical protein
VISQVSDTSQPEKPADLQRFLSCHRDGAMATSIENDDLFGQLSDPACGLAIGTVSDQMRGNMRMNGHIPPLNRLNSL